MKVRNELNKLLYENKMDNLKIPERIEHCSRFTAIADGNVETVSEKLKNGELALTSDKRVLSQNALNNAVYHFVLSASGISETGYEKSIGKIAKNQAEISAGLKGTLSRSSLKRTRTSL